VSEIPPNVRSLSIVLPVCIYEEHSEIDFFFHADRHLLILEDLLQLFHTAPALEEIHISLSNKVVIGYVNKDGKEDHKMVSRRLKWAVRKLQDTLNSPSFATAIAGHKMPVEQPSAAITEKLSVIIKGLEESINDERD
jgi:hypothetical protein